MSLALEGRHDTFVLNCSVATSNPVQWIFTPHQRTESFSISFNDIISPSFNHFRLHKGDRGSRNLHLKDDHKLNVSLIAGNYKCVENNGAGPSVEAEVISLGIYFNFSSHVLS